MGHTVEPKRDPVTLTKTTYVRINTYVNEFVLLAKVRTFITYVRYVYVEMSLYVRIRIRRSETKFIMWKTSKRTVYMALNSTAAECTFVPLFALPRLFALLQLLRKLFALLQLLRKLFALLLLLFSLLPLADLLRVAPIDPYHGLTESAEARHTSLASRA